MDRCLNCGGAIGEPGKIYGYAGKWCYCPENPISVYRRPASKERPQQRDNNTTSASSLTTPNSKTPSVAKIDLWVAALNGFTVGVLYCSILYCWGRKRADDDA